MGKGKVPVVSYRLLRQPPEHGESEYSAIDWFRAAMDSTSAACAAPSCLLAADSRSLSEDPSFLFLLPPATVAVVTPCAATADQFSMSKCMGKGMCLPYLTVCSQPFRGWALQVGQNQEPVGMRSIFGLRQRRW